MVSNSSKNRGLLGVVLIILMLLGDLLVGFADSPGKLSTFTQALADSFYCFTSGHNGGSYVNLNCNDAYCGTPANNAANGFESCPGCPTSTEQGAYGITPCISNIPVGQCYMQMTKTTITAFSSAVFTNIVSGGTWTCPTGITRVASDIVQCTATFDYDTSVAATVARFRFHNTGGGNSAVTLQIGPSAALNSNETIAMTSILTNIITTTWSFQVAVTGVGGSINIGPGEADCFWDVGTGSGPAG